MTLWLKRKIFVFHLLFFLPLLGGFVWPFFYYQSLSLFNLLFIVFSLILGRSLIDKRRLVFFVPPWLLLNSAALYASLLSQFYLAVLILLLAGLLSYYYFLGFRQRLNRDSNFNLGSFSVWSDILSLLLVFFGSSFIYALVYFLNVNIWLLGLLICLLLFIVFRQNIFIVKKDSSRILSSTLLISLALSPIVWSLFFLPFNYNFLGLILSVIYYGALNLVRFHLGETLTKKKIKYNLIFIIALLLIIFLTVKWR